MLKNTKDNIAIVLLLSIVLLSCNQTDNSSKSKKESTKHEAVSPHPSIKKDTATKDFVWNKPVYDTTKKYIYLTFDDGPQGYGTQNCLDLCKQQNIKATFFMIGMQGKDVWGKAKAEEIRGLYPQFLVANHSYTHTREHYKYFYSHPQMAIEDFFQAQKSLNVPFKIIRLPGNSAWVRKDELKSAPMVKTVCKLLDSAGYNVMGWDVEWSFNHKNAYPVQSAEKMAKQVVNALENKTHTQNHVVILTHDRMFRLPQYADSLNKFIAILKQHNNYVFETMNNYPDMKMP